MTNSPRYDAAMDSARLLGGNFKLIRERKRALAVDLVAASVVEGFALAEAIKAAKSKMGWTKLATDEQGQMNVLFNAVRTIDGAWKVLAEDTQKAFLAGELVFSTLAKSIKDAEKAALEAEAEAEDAEAEAEANRETPVGEDGKPVMADPMVEAMGKLEGWLSLQADGQNLTPAQAIALHSLMGAFTDFNARVAKAASKAA